MFMPDEKITLSDLQTFVWKFAWIPTFIEDEFGIIDMIFSLLEFLLQHESDENKT